MTYAPLKLDDYVYPPWANAIGWIMSLTSIACVPACFAWTVCKPDGTVRKVSIV